MLILLSKKDIWVTALINDGLCEAKVYNEPSAYGFNNGRVSKLVISKTSDRPVDYSNDCDFSYDRGLNFNHLPEGEAESIVAQLENLPPLYVAND